MAGVCNCRFVLLPTDPSDRNGHIPAADVRIRFSYNNDSSWSLIGTDILEQPDRHQPTMSIAMSKANIDPITPEFIQTLLHETGHTLGFVHEHLRPGLVERIDEKKAITYYKTQVGWTEDRTRHEVLKRLSPTRAYDISSKPDDVSIMCYPFTQHILKDGSDAIRGGKTLSKYDKKHAAAVYPILKPERREMKEGEVDRITPKDSYFAVKDGIVVEQFEVDQHCQCSPPSTFNPRSHLI
ncbi:response to abiotic stimulus [Marasmius tenuissimus]|uniref:Response to abiotic stimulus n=1 Tax=Marasmius tenuissimus TaxID=585030 RepID=A0ABR2ZBR8_9AGAR